MKVCLVDGCEMGVFGKGYCKRHQFMRTDKTNKRDFRAVEPRSLIKPYKTPTLNKQGLKTTKQELMYRWGFESQSAMFKHIWEAREHKCIFTGADLDLVPKYQWSWMFMHIIRKGKYPMFKYNPENIVLGHPNFHLAADNFTEEERKLHPEWNFNLWFELVEQKKKEYNEFLKVNQI